MDTSPALALPPYRASQLPAGTRGDWSLIKVRLPERVADRVVDARPNAFRFRSGEYTELRHAGVTFMTDLYDEWWTQRRAIERARCVGGKVLITGLGLGMVVEAMLSTPALATVRSVTVLEQSADVIGLVAPHLQRQFADRVEIVHADAFAWQPSVPVRFDTVWHDIWPDPDAAHVDADIALLRRQHQPWSDWQGFWPIDYRDALNDRR
jgi:hypothetical protein